MPFLLVFVAYLREASTNIFSLIMVNSFAFRYQQDLITVPSKVFQPLQVRLHKVHSLSCQFMFLLGSMLAPSPCVIHHSIDAAKLCIPSTINTNYIQGCHSGMPLLPPAISIFQNPALGLWGLVSCGGPDIC